MNGILAIDKPFGWTSHDVVAKVRVLARQRRIGHAGTLDPMATGVLLVCLGDATRVSDALMEGTKWYLARVAFGAATTTDDALGTVTSLHRPRFTLGQLVASLEQFTGSIEQRPPAFAAIKRDGVPAYKRARKGQEVELASRPVQIHSVSLLEFTPPDGPPSDGMVDGAETVPAFWHGLRNTAHFLRQGHVYPVDRAGSWAPHLVVARTSADSAAWQAAAFRRSTP